MIYILILLVLAIILYVFLTYNNKKKKNTQNNKVQAIKKKSSIDSLLDLNISIRKKIYNLNTIEYIEIVIDKLREVIPELDDNYGSNELTWSVNNMATQYLQKVLDPFVKLSQEQQENKKSALLESIKKIEDELDEVILMLNEKDESQFDKKAKFINHRFSDKF